MKPIFKLSLLVAALGLAFLAGCSISMPRQMAAESFRQQFEISESARSSIFIGVTETRAYAERTELVGLRPLMGLGPKVEVVWTPLADFTPEERSSLVAGKIPWSPILGRVANP